MNKYLGWISFVLALLFALFLHLSMTRSFDSLPEEGLVQAVGFGLPMLVCAGATLELWRKSKSLIIFFSWVCIAVGIVWVVSFFWFVLSGDSFGDFDEIGTIFGFVSLIFICGGTGFALLSD